MRRGKVSLSYEGNVCACAYVCMTLCVAGRWISSERLCTVMYLREWDSVRNYECVCEVVTFRAWQPLCVCLVEIITRLGVGRF